MKWTLVVLLVPTILLGCCPAPEPQVHLKVDEGTLRVITDEAGEKWWAFFDKEGHLIGPMIYKGIFDR